jgi:hypothetical protein
MLSVSQTKPASANAQKYPCSGDPDEQTLPEHMAHGLHQLRHLYEDVPASHNE